MITTNLIKPKRIAIIGLPGSGKSTFATRLGKILNIPVYHLDAYQFLDQRGNKRNKEEFITIQQEMLDGESWIIEGCSISTLDMRFNRADTVIYLRFSRLLCIWRCLKRVFTINQDLAESGCYHFINWTLVKYIWTFEKDKSAKIEELKNQYSHLDFHVFCDSQEVEKYLKQLNLSR